MLKTSIIKLKMRIEEEEEKGMLNLPEKTGNFVA